MVRRISSSFHYLNTTFYLCYLKIVRGLVWNTKKDTERTFIILED